MATRIIAMISFQETVTQATVTVESRFLIRDGLQLQGDSGRIQEQIILDLFEIWCLEFGI
jgi:hypothetical protein